MVKVVLCTECGWLKPPPSAGAVNLAASLIQSYGQRKHCHIYTSLENTSRDAATIKCWRSLLSIKLNFPQAHDFPQGLTASCKVLSCLLMTKPSKSQTLLVFDKCWLSIFHLSPSYLFPQQWRTTSLRLKKKARSISPIALNSCNVIFFQEISDIDEEFILKQFDIDYETKPSHDALHTMKPNQVALELKRSVGLSKLQEPTFFQKTGYERKLQKPQVIAEGDQSENQRKLSCIEVLKFLNSGVSWVLVF